MLRRSGQAAAVSGGIGCFYLMGAMNKSWGDMISPREKCETCGACAECPNDRCMHYAAGDPGTCHQAACIYCALFTRRDRLFLGNVG